MFKKIKAAFGFIDKEAKGEELTRLKNIRKGVSLIGSAILLILGMELLAYVGMVIALVSICLSIGTMLTSGFSHLFLNKESNFSLRVSIR